MTKAAEFEVSSMPLGNSSGQNWEPSVLASCSDEQLVELLVSGNQDAMTVIFDRYYAMMMRVALRIVRDSGEAEDAVQIAFTDFYRNAKQFDASKGRLSTWLLQYICGRSINRLDRLKSRRHFSHIELADVAPSELAANAGEHFRLSSQEAKVFVEQVLKSLNEEHRRVVELICFAGLTIREAATVTGASPGNIQHHYYRSLKKLRAEFCVGTQNHDEPIPAQGKHSLWSLRKTSKSEEVLTREVENAKAQIL
jgi:RNA polymerase sigma-70 factor (ECF subfamily)